MFDFRRTTIERICKNTEEKRIEEKPGRKAPTVYSCPAHLAPALQLGAPKSLKMKLPSLTKILLKTHMPQMEHSFHTYPNKMTY